MAGSTYWHRSSCRQLAGEWNWLLRARDAEGGEHYRADDEEGFVKEVCFHRFSLWRIFLSIFFSPEWQRKVSEYFCRARQHLNLWVICSRGRRPRQRHPEPEPGPAIPATTAARMSGIAPNLRRYFPPY
jgi:hypothetical protein